MHKTTLVVQICRNRISLDRCDLLGGMRQRDGGSWLAPPILWCATGAVVGSTTRA